MAAWDEIDRYMILSSDSHGGAALLEYRDHLDPAWRDEFDAWAAAVTNPWVDLRDPERAAVNWDSDRRTAALDREGVTGEVIFPNTLTPFYDILCHLSGVPRERGELRRRWAGLRAHNRWLATFCEAEPTRRRGVVQLLPNDVEAAVEEVRWAAESGVIGGVMLPAVPPNHPVEPLYHPRYDALWDACAATGLPVHQHLGSGSPDVAAELAVTRAITFVEHELWPKRTLLHLIVGGVFERHPRLRVVWTEMWGMRWVLEELHRIEQRLRVVQSRFASDPNQLNYAAVFGGDTVDGLGLSPLGYWRRNCYLGASMLPRADVGYRHAVGVDRIMWGNDFPHDEGTVGHTTEALRATLHDVPEPECRAMLAGVAADVYRFDVPALTNLAARIGPLVAEVHQPLEQRPVSPAEAFSTVPPLEDLLHAGTFGASSG